MCVCVCVCVCINTRICVCLCVCVCVFVYSNIALHVLVVEGIVVISGTGSLVLSLHWLVKSIRIAVSRHQRDTVTASTPVQFLRD